MRPTVQRERNSARWRNWAASHAGSTSHLRRLKLFAVLTRPAKLLLWIGGGLLLWFLGRPAAFLTAVWWRERAASLPMPAVGTGDVSRFSRAQPSRVIIVSEDPAVAEIQLATLVQEAASAQQKISISGAQHAMGGHTLVDGGWALDMRPFCHMKLDTERKLVTVGAGARWADILPLLDAHGLSVAIMQSNNDFTIGGSLSVNCHGWQHNAPPIASTVESLRVVTAAGEIVRCSRSQEPELFAHVLGGYGLFGVILDVELRVVANEFYQAEPLGVTPAKYAGEFRQHVVGDASIGMAYGRISVAPDSFLREASLVVLRRVATERSVQNTLRHGSPGELKRLVFRAEVGSGYGKNLRWMLEQHVGETGGALLSRNQILQEPSGWFSNRDPEATEVLHEYFVPMNRLGEFVEQIRPILLRRKPDLLNITVRSVQADLDTALRFAREDVFGLVMLFHQQRTEASDTQMRELTSELIEAVLRCGGTYYLPYRPHATRDQFARAYPQAKAFFAAKQRWDSAEIFVNQFYLNYGGL